MKLDTSKIFFAYETINMAIEGVYYLIGAKAFYQVERDGEKFYKRIGDDSSYLFKEYDKNNIQDSSIDNIVPMTAVMQNPIPEKVSLKTIRLYLLKYQVLSLFDKKENKDKGIQKRK